MNDDENLTPEERLQQERFREHQARFKARRQQIGFVRWMAGRYRGCNRTLPCTIGLIRGRYRHQKMTEQVDVAFSQALFIFPQ